MQPENTLRYPGWRVAIAASGAVFFSFASLFVYSFGVFLKPISAQFHWSREAVSLAFGFAAMCIAAASPLLGALLDRRPPRRIILPCFAVFGVGFASLSLLTPHLWHLYAVFIVLGLVGNGTAQLAYSGALATWFETRRGLAFAILLSGSALGATVWPLVSQILITSTSWRTAFAVMGCSILLFALPLASQVKPHGRVLRRATSRSAVDGLLSRSFWIIIGILFASSLGQNGAITHLAALLTDRGVSSGLAATAVSLLGAATLVGRFATGWLLDRYFAPYVSVCLLSLAAVGIYILSGTHSALGGCTAAALIGLGMGGEGDITPYLLSRYFDLQSFSTLYGFTWTAYAIAGAIGPVIMGRAFDLTGSYEKLLLALSLLSLITALLSLLLPRYKVAPKFLEPIVALETQS